MFDLAWLLSYPFNGARVSYPPNLNYLPTEAIAVYANY